jgi:ABC-type hemin transport system substrate-binding protein
MNRTGSGNESRPKKDNATGYYRKLHSEGIVFSSPNTTEIIKSRRMRREKYIANTGKM